MSVGDNSMYSRLLNPEMTDVSLPPKNLPFSLKIPIFRKSLRSWGKLNGTCGFNATCSFDIILSYPYLILKKIIFSHSRSKFHAIKLETGSEACEKIEWKMLEVSYLRLVVVIWNDLWTLLRNHAAPGVLWSSALFESSLIALHTAAAAAPCRALTHHSSPAEHNRGFLVSGRPARGSWSLRPIVDK